MRAGESFLYMTIESPEVATARLFIRGIPLTHLTIHDTKDFFLSMMCGAGLSFADTIFPRAKVAGHSGLVYPVLRAETIDS